jgi:hypothetical protein
MHSIFRRLLIATLAALPFCSCAQSFAGTVASVVSHQTVTSVPAADSGASPNDVAIPGFVFKGLLCEMGLSGLQSLEPFSSSLSSASVSRSTAIPAAQVGGAFASASSGRQLAPPDLPVVTGLLGLAASAGAERDSTHRPTRDLSDGLHGSNGSAPQSPEPPVPGGGEEAAGMGWVSITQNRGEVVALFSSPCAVNHESKSRQVFFEIQLSPVCQSIHIFRPPRFCA